MNTGLFEQLQRKLDEQEAAGLTMTEVLTMAAPLRRLVNWMLRQPPVTFTDVMAFVAEDEGATRAMLKALMEKGIVHSVNDAEVLRYRVQIAPRRGRPIPLNIWQSLEEKIQNEQEYLP
ncbi:MAG TPA: hypothetical protein PKH77_05255 [Anaerolineae bacterium]|nr:hypothetical protein [Anaerolineae bacterium]